VKPEYTISEQRGGAFGVYRAHGQQEVSHFRESVDYDENGIES
jgi:hypothetical protein